MAQTLHNSCASLILAQLLVPMGREQLVLALVACVLASAAAQAPPLQNLHIRPGFQISTFSYGVERARQLAISKANPFIVYTGSNEAPVRWAPSARSQFSLSACPAATEQALQPPGQLVLLRFLGLSQQ